MPEVVQNAWVPLPGWLLVRPVETVDTLGSLVVPQVAIDQMTRCQYEVVASGGHLPLEEVEDSPSHCGAGDWIVAPPRLAIHVLEEGITLLPERQVWAILE